MTVSIPAELRPGAASEVECDLLIAGTGAAGLAAAVTASACGLRTLVVEKADVYGGTTAYSAGVAWIPCNTEATRMGVADSHEAALSYIRHEAGRHFDEVTARAFVTRANEALEFLQANSAVRFSLAPGWPDYHPEAPGGSAGGRSMFPDPFDGRLLGDRFRSLRWPLSTTLVFGGMTVARADVPHFFRMTRSLSSAAYVAKLMARYAVDRLKHPRGTRIANGNALIARLAKGLFERDVPLWLSTSLTRLLTSEGQVVGAELRHEGRVITVRARRGVVLACGGFPRNDSLRQRYYPHVSAGQPHLPLGPAENTGDGLRLAVAAGAALKEAVHQPAAWTPVSVVPSKTGEDILYPHFLDRNKPGFIAVDRDGARFVNEADSYHDFVAAMLEHCAGRAVAEAFLICDHRAIRRYGLGVAPPAPGRIGPHVRNGYLVRADTLAELGRAAGISPKGLEATIRAYNEGAREGVDRLFDKGRNVYNRYCGDPEHKPNACVAPLDTAPFYALRVLPGDLGTFVGIRADEHSRALDGQGSPIPGLYVAGNDMASVMGGEYTGAGITVGPGLTFGYIAAMHAAGR